MSVEPQGLAEHPLTRLILDNLDHETREIPEEAAYWVMDHPDEAQPFLLSLAAAATLRADHSLGDGNLPALAVYLLSYLNEPSTIEPLLEVLTDIRHSMPEAMHRQPVWDMLVSMTDIVIEPALRCYEPSTTTKARRNAAMFLGEFTSRPRCSGTTLTYRQTDRCVSVRVRTPRVGLEPRGLGPPG